ncbi:MAG TPA: ferrous iron transport protein B [Pyrinomonadaceae bacterium]|nr:ferrous iron transport protein B [Pyrinomonadaceae bacterium]
MIHTQQSPSNGTNGSDAPGDRQHASRVLTVALAGNPNAGKTSLFNALTGMRQKVANYPGVTVERKEGVWPLGPDGTHARLVDLPGLYSLDAASIDERIARDVLTGRVAEVPRPDVVVAVVDATNLERNLYLTTQLLEMGRPLVVALTMVDLAERARVEIDAAKLSAAIGAAVVPVTSTRGRGLEELAAAVVAAAAKETGAGAGWRLSPQAEAELAAFINANVGNGLAGATSSSAAITTGTAAPAATSRAANLSAPTAAPPSPPRPRGDERHEALLTLYGEELPADESLRARVEAARARLAGANPHWWQEPIVARYEWIAGAARDAVRDRGRGARTRSATERIDRFVTHKLFGPAILLGVMLVVLQTIFTWAQLPMDLIDGGFGALGELARERMPAGLLTDLIVDGVIAGVGGVLVFLPQILLLFLFIALLEDSGYMARAAFLMDRLMRGVGLHGKAFMPLLSSFACAIPGIMATRTIEQPKDRLATILIAPFMSCSARLPVYTLMIAAFFTERKVFGVLSVGVLLILAMYLLGVAVAVAVAWVLKHTILKAPPPPLVLELPPYRMPNASNVLHTIFSRAWMFVRRAGTVILAISILLWALVTFPRTEIVSPADEAAVEQQAAGGRNGGAGEESEREETVQPAAGASNVAEAVEDEGARSEEGEQIRQSFAGRLGRLIEPAIRPLGFDWQMGIGLIASFAARETLVSTLSIVYNAGDGAGEESASLVEAVRNARRPDGSRAWTPLVAVSMMVLFVLACQCMSTVAVVRRETNSWRWPLFMVGYMLALAYVASLITFQGGRLLGFS